MDAKPFGGAMQVGDLVRTKEFYLPTRPLGLIIKSKVWDLKGSGYGKITFLVQFVNGTSPQWWTEEHLEIVCE